MDLYKETTLEKILLRIFKKSPSTVDFFFTAKIIDKIEDYTFRDLFEKPIKEYLVRKIRDDLKEKTGQRLDILTELFKGTPFEEHFSYVTRLGNNECAKENGKHAFAHHYNDRDMNESQTYHCCVFCGEEIETTRGSGGAKDAFINAGGKAYDKFREARKLLQALIIQNPSDKEITAFVEKLMDITL
jgi:hypothetical protein